MHIIMLIIKNKYKTIDVTNFMVTEYASNNGNDLHQGGSNYNAENPGQRYDVT